MSSITKQNNIHASSASMSLSSANSAAASSLASNYISLTTPSNSNESTSMPGDLDLKNIGSTDSPGESYPTNGNSLASNNHHKSSQHNLYSASPLTNDVWMSAMNQQMPLPNLTDAILETDIFYPLGKLNVASGIPSSPNKESKVPSNIIVSNSSPFVSNIPSQYTPTTSSSIFGNMSAGSGAGKFAQEMPCLIPNNFNKMDVEDPFNISEALNNATSRTDSVSNSENMKNGNIYKKMIESASSNSNFLNVDIKESPNTTPRNISPILTPRAKSPAYPDLFMTSHSSVLFSTGGVLTADNHNVQSIPLSALRSESIVNNVNALPSEGIESKQEESFESKDHSTKTEPLNTDTNSLGMTLDDIVNMYRLKGNSHNENHYMSETSSNASSCSSVCGWSYGGSSNINGSSEHVLENKHGQGNGKEKLGGNNGNSRNSNHHYSQFKRSDSMSRFGLDPIPEMYVPEDPPVFQPLVPPAVVVPKPFSENISFPTTLQPRANDRLNICRPGVAPSAELTTTQINQQQKQFTVNSFNSSTNVTSVPPIVLNHSPPNSSNESYIRNEVEKLENNFRTVKNGNNDINDYLCSNASNIAPTDSSMADPKRGETKHFTSHSASPSSQSYVSTKDLEVAMHIDPNFSYQSSPSSRVSSPTLDKLDSSTSATNQRSSRHFTKPSKRSRSNTPTNMNTIDMRDYEAIDAGASSRQRRKSNAGDNPAGTKLSETRDRSPRREKETSSSQSKNSNKHNDNSFAIKSESKLDEPMQTLKVKKEDPVKQGLEKLQEILPHLGSPGEEKVSQANILYETGKYMMKMKKSQTETTDEITSIQEKIENLNMQIEEWQNKLPENGAPLLDPAKMAVKRKTLHEMFHGHVVSKVKDEEIWRYWVFTSIMGHFVHSFNSDVDSTGKMDELQNSATEWIKEKMSLQQLRKDAFRKLSKISAKTSILEDPSKLPQEALSFVQHAQYLPPGALTSHPSSASSTCSTTSSNTTSISLNQSKHLKR